MPQSFSPRQSSQLRQEVLPKVDAASRNVRSARDHKSPTSKPAERPNQPLDVMLDRNRMNDLYERSSI